MLIAGSQRRRLNVPDENYSDCFLMQHLIAMLSTTSHTLFVLLKMRIQHSFGLMFPAGQLQAVYQRVPQSAPETHPCTVPYWISLASYRDRAAQENRQE